MKLQYKEQILDASKEHEILATNEHGFTVTVKFKDDSWYKGQTQVFNNLTEVHHRFTDLFNPTPSKKIALESDIHRTGGTRELKDIESIHIVEATEIADSY